MRVVLDTNVVTSAFLSRHGAPAKVFAIWEQGGFELVVSEAILAEYERVFHYQHLVSRHGMSDEEIAQVIGRLRKIALFVEIEQPLAVIRQDPDDDKFVECAVAGSADYIVSGDTHLLTLGEYEDIQVLPPAAFLSLFSPLAPQT
ncbi:MAG: putative toxin-antitoxin system toxin component, PIN family [Chloroflexota bacterium]